MLVPIFPFVFCSNVPRCFPCQCSLPRAARDNWVRVRSGLYKDDLAKVVDVDHAAQKATVRLVPRVDLQAMATRVGAAACQGAGKRCLGRPLFLCQ